MSDCNQCGKSIMQGQLLCTSHLCPYGFGPKLHQSMPIKTNEVGSIQNDKPVLGDMFLPLIKPKKIPGDVDKFLGEAALTGVLGSLGLMYVAYIVISAYNAVLGPTQTSAQQSSMQNNQTVGPSMPTPIGIYHVWSNNAAQRIQGRTESEVYRRATEACNDSNRNCSFVTTINSPTPMCVEYTQRNNNRNFEINRFSDPAQVSLVRRFVVAPHLTQWVNIVCNDDDTQRRISGILNPVMSQARENLRAGRATDRSAVDEAIERARTNAPVPIVPPQQRPASPAPVPAALPAPMPSITEQFRPFSNTGVFHITTTGETQRVFGPSREEAEQRARNCRQFSTNPNCTYVGSLSNDGPRCLEYTIDPANSRQFIVRSFQTAADAQLSHRMSMMGYRDVRLVCNSPTLEAATKRELEPIQARHHEQLNRLRNGQFPPPPGVLYPRSGGAASMPTP